MKWNIGDIIQDEDGNTGIVCIKWNDGDLCTIENDAAHPHPALTEEPFDLIKLRPFLISFSSNS
jgi:hypothetical protein